MKYKHVWIKLVDDVVKDYHPLVNGVILGGEDTQQMLDDMGEEGWTMCGVDSTADYKIFFFVKGEMTATG